MSGNIFGGRNTGTGSSGGDDTIVNTGTVSGNIFGGRNTGTGSSGGDDTITNRGTVGGGIYAGDGDDRVNLENGSSVGGTVGGGSGTDTLALSNMGTQDGSLWGTTYVNFENLAFYGGRTTLTGDWSISGATTVEAGGVAIVNGTLTSDTLTNNGTLGGGGSIVGNVTNNGTVSPGNSIGTLTIDGDFTNTSSGALAVELGQGSGDRLMVSGTAYLNGGTLRASLEPGVYTGGTSWTVLSAGSIVGSFASLNFLLGSVVLSLSVSISSDSISLALSRASYADFGQTANQRVIGERLNDIVPLAVNRDDEMTSLITAMDFAYSAAQISAALEQLSPEMYSAFAWSSLQSAQAFGDVIDQQMDQERDSLRLGMPPGEDSPHGLRLWARFWGSTAQRQGDSQHLGYGQTLDGLALGGDGALAPWLNLGLALGVSRGDLSWDRPSYYGRMDNFHAGLYARAAWGGALSAGSAWLCLQRLHRPAVH